MQKSDSLSAYRSLPQKIQSLRGNWLDRGFHVSIAAQEDIKIEVPQMGDSITEGTIASIERKAGKPQFEFGKEHPLQHRLQLPL